MKRFILVFLLILPLCLSQYASGAEAEKSVTYYVEIQGNTGRSLRPGMMDVTVSLGRQLRQLTSLSAEDTRRASRSFSSMVDAMNWLAGYGWRLVTTYTLPAAASSQTIVWVAAKDVMSPMELLDGFIDEK